MRYVQISFFDMKNKNSLKSKVVTKAMEIVKKVKGVWRDRISYAFRQAWREVKAISLNLTIDTTVKISRGWQYQEIRF